MMKLFAVRDVKADAFGAPMSIATKGLAIRSFTDACADRKSDLNRFSDDYSLYELGSYDPNSGLIVTNPMPVFIISASEVLSSAKTILEVSEPVLPGVAS